MKKLTALLTILVMVITLSGCGEAPEKAYTTEEVVAKIDNKESFVMVASSTTCSYCKDFKVEVKEYRTQNSESDIVFVEIDEIRLYQDRVNFINLFQVTSTPTSYFYREGKLVNVEEGVIQSDDLADLYDKHVLGK